MTRSKYSGRAFYSDDKEYAEKKQKEMHEKRENGGWYMELGTMGHVSYSEWTCPYCFQTLRNAQGTTRPAVHKIKHCDKFPDANQSDLEAFA